MLCGRGNVENAVDGFLDTFTAPFGLAQQYSAKRAMKGTFSGLSDTNGNAYHHKSL